MKERIKIAVRYQSRNGNTRAVAEIIAQIAGVQAEPIDIPIEENVDLLFLGGAVYGWKADPALMDFLQKLDATMTREIAAFSTSAGGKQALRLMEKTARQKNISYNKNSLLLKLGRQGHALLGREGGHLTPEQIQTVKEFANSVLISSER